MSPNDNSGLADLNRQFLSLTSKFAADPCRPGPYRV